MGRSWRDQGMGGWSHWIELYGCVFLGVCYNACLRSTIANNNRPVCREDTMGSAPERRTKAEQPTSGGKGAPLTTRCPFCSTEINIPRDSEQQLWNGIKVPCPDCGKIISIKFG